MTIEDYDANQTNKEDEHPKVSVFEDPDVPQPV